MNIDIDRDLLEEFKAVSKSRTNHEAVNAALLEGIRKYKRMLLLELQGKVVWDMDHKA